MENIDTIFYNAHIYYQKQFVNGALLIKDGKVSGIQTDTQKPQIDAKKAVDIQGKYLLPGFVDIHTHGGGGI
jgi:N-acetylglucosamine-6-phosphate deacetylase